MFSLRSENLGTLGTYMGNGYSFDNWIKYFTTLEKAKAYAEKDYGKPIEWVDVSMGVRSPDLLWVMYHIHKIEVEE